MRAVVNSGAVTRENGAIAARIIRAEIKAMVFGDEYAWAREGAKDGSMSASFVVGCVSAACVIKIRKEC
jgi:hypothetical protein